MTKLSKKLKELHLGFLKKAGFKNPILSRSTRYRHWLSMCGKVAAVFHTCGSVRRQPKVLKPRFGTNGYVMLKVRGVNKSLHRIIAQDYIAKRTLSLTEIVHHKNGNRRDNRVVNLQVTTYSVNNVHAWKTRRRNQNGKKKGR